LGTSDKIWVKLTCPGCNVTETSSALDKGSGWGGPHWRNYGEFKLFDAKCEGGAKDEPAVTSASCKACGEKATINEAYGFGRPEGF